MGLQLRVRDPRGPPGTADRDVGVRQGVVDVTAKALVHRRDHVARRVGDAVFERPVRMQQRRARRPCLLRIEHRGQHLVLDHDAAGRVLRGRERVGDHGGDPLSDEADDRVEHEGVVGVVGPDLVARGGKPRRRDIEMREDHFDAGHLLGGLGIDCHDPGVCMG